MDEPVLIDTEPDGPADDAPDETLTAPLLGELAEFMTTEPLESPPAPLVTVIEPPKPSCDANEPALSRSEPPLPDNPAPTPTMIAPPSLDESPVVSASEPDAVELDEPVDTDTDPLLVSSSLLSLVATATLAPEAL
jgi:hypothetical protein